MCCWLAAAQALRLLVPILGQVRVSVASSGRLSHVRGLGPPCRISRMSVAPRGRRNRSPVGGRAGVRLIARRAARLAKCPARRRLAHRVTGLRGAIRGLGGLGSSSGMTTSAGSPARCALRDQVREMPLLCDAAGAARRQGAPGTETVAAVPCRAGSRPGPAAGEGRWLLQSTTSSSSAAARSALANRCRGNRHPGARAEAAGPTIRGTCTSTSRPRYLPDREQVLRLGYESEPRRT